MTGTQSFIAAVGLCLAAAAAAAQDIRTERVAFPPGATGTTIEGTITGRESVSYLVGAQAGQTMVLSLGADNDATYFNLYAPGSGPGDEALAIGEMQPVINRFEGVLPASGTYTVSVFLYRSAARRGERSRYRLDIAIPAGGADLSAPVQGDFADGLEGGPDFWEVRSSGMLNLRRGPSTGAAVVGRAEPGQVLRNLGCRMNEGRRWCRVATFGDPGTEGWAAGDFLGESSYVAGGAGVATQLPDRAPVGGFDATGLVACFAAPGGPEETCPIGVVREGGGSGMVSVTLPDGSLRVVTFEAGAATGFDRAQSDGAMAFRATRQGDDTLVTIGNQSVVIPDAVIWGG